MDPRLTAFLRDVRNHPTFDRFAEVGVHTRNATGETALHHAAIQGNLEIVRLLLAAGAEPDLAGEHGFTPLHEAILQGHVEIIRQLLAAGADPLLKNEWGKDAAGLSKLDHPLGLQQSIRHLIQRAIDGEPLVE